MSVVVSDASPLNYLIWIGALAAEPPRSRLIE